MGCMHQALACLAHLASHRPRLPCLHQQQQQQRSAPPGRRRRPGCCCEVQARRARPMRGEVSQATPGKVRRPVLAKSGPGLALAFALAPARLLLRPLYLVPGPLYGGSLGPLFTWYFLCSPVVWSQNRHCHVNAPTTAKN